MPGILPDGDQVTIRMLLNHTSGIPDNALEPLVTLYTIPGGRSRAWTPQELVALIADRPPDFPPGTAWSYSSTGYVLAGMIVEAATGRTLGHELTRRILRPLGLRDTFFPVNRPTIPGPNPQGAACRWPDEAGPLVDFTVYNPSLAWGAGNLISDLGDLARSFTWPAGRPPAASEAAGRDDDLGRHRHARLRLRPARGAADAWGADRP